MSYRNFKSPTTSSTLTNILSGSFSSGMPVLSSLRQTHSFQEGKNDMMIYLILTTADLTEPNASQVFIAKISNMELRLCFIGGEYSTWRKQIKSY